MNKLKLSPPGDFSTMEKTQDALEERQENVETSVKSIQITQKNLNWYLNDKAAGAQVATGLKDMAEVQLRTKAVLIQMRDIVQNSQAPGLISTEQKQKGLGKWEKVGQEVEKMLVNLEETLDLLKANQDHQKQQLYEPYEQLTRFFKKFFKRGKLRADKESSAKDRETTASPDRLFLIDERNLIATMPVIPEGDEMQDLREMMRDMDRVEELRAELEALQKNSDGYMGHAERRQEKANKFWWKLPLSNKEQLTAMKNAFYKTKETLANLKEQNDWGWLEMLALQNPEVAEEKAEEWRRFRTMLEAQCEKQDGIRVQIKAIAKLQKSDMIAGLKTVLEEFDLQTDEFDNLKEKGLAFELASTIAEDLLQKMRDITACWKVTNIDINEVPELKTKIQLLLLLEEQNPQEPQQAPFAPLWEPFSSLTL